MKRLIVCKDLIDAQDYVSEEQRALNGIATTTTNAPSAQNNSTCDGDANQGRVDIADPRELKHPP